MPDHSKITMTWVVGPIEADKDLDKVVAVLCDAVEEFIMNSGLVLDDGETVPTWDVQEMPAGWSPQQ